MIRSTHLSLSRAALTLSLAACALAASLTACLAPDAIPSDLSGAGGSGGSGSGAGTGTGGTPDEQLAWARAYGPDAPSDQRAWSVAAAPDNGVLVAGDFQGSLTIPPLPTLANTDGRDAFAAMFDEQGEPLWIASFSGLGEQRAYRAIPTPDGGVIVAGSFEQSLLIAGVESGNAPQGRDGFVAALDDKLALRWLVRADGPGNQAIHALALAPDGDVIIAGTFQDTLHLDDVVIAADDDDAAGDFFVGRISAAGIPQWATALGGDPADIAPSGPVCFVAVAPKGTIHVAGTFSGTVRLGENLGAVGARDAFVGALSSSGAPLWGHAIGASGGEQQVAALAVDGLGRTLLAGDLQGTATFSSSTELASEGDAPDAFLALYDAMGDLTWARRYGSKAEDHASAAAFDPDGDILFAGRFRGAIHFGPEEPLVNGQAVSPSDDIFLAKLTSDAAPIYSRSFGKDQDQLPTALASDAAGHALLTGYFRGIVDFGSGDLDAKIGDDFFLAKFGK